MYKIKPLLYFEIDKVEEYFQLLDVHDFLSSRFCDCKNPKWLDVLGIINARKGLHMYGVENTDGRIVGEFHLEQFTGLSAMMHFSMSPEVSFPEKIKIGRFVLDYLFSKWIDSKTGKPYLRSVFGLTPSDNRAALVLARKVGFKVLGVLPSGIISKGKPTDATISVASA